MLDGMFSFVLLDESVHPSRIIAARDPIGITTLYKGWNSKAPKVVYFASELKALVDDCDEIISFPPGHVYDSRTGNTERYYRPSWWDDDQENVPLPALPVQLKLLRETLEAAVRKRLMSEVPYGVLLSGGLDSSLIAAVAARETEKVAQAQYEARQQRLARVQLSGPSTPSEGVVTEDCRSPLCSCLTHLCQRHYTSSNHRLVASAPLIFDRSSAFSGPRSGPKSGGLFRDGPP